MGLEEFFKKKLSEAKTDTEKTKWKNILTAHQAMEERLKHDKSTEFFDELPSKSKKELARMLGMGYKGDYYKAIIQEYNSR